jgi:hypothetical protein
MGAAAAPETDAPAITEAAAPTMTILLDRLNMMAFLPDFLLDQ